MFQKYSERLPHSSPRKPLFGVFLYSKESWPCACIPFSHQFPVPWPHLSHQLRHFCRISQFIPSRTSLSINEPPLNLFAPRSCHGYSTSIFSKLSLIFLHPQNPRPSQFGLGCALLSLVAALPWQGSSTHPSSPNETAAILPHSAHSVQNLFAFCCAFNAAELCFKGISSVLYNPFFYCCLVFFFF